MGLIDQARAANAAFQEKKQSRKRLRGPAPLQYALADDIHLLNPSVWDQATAGGSVFLSRAYLSSLQGVLPENMQARYALITTPTPTGSIPVAAVVMQIVDIAIAEARANAQPKGAARWLEPVTQKLTAHTVQRVLVCGNFLTYGQHGLAIAAGADARLAWHGVAEVLYRVRKAEKLVGKTHFVLIKDLHGPWASSARLLEDLSYRWVETEPNMVLTLDPQWRSYDDYLGGLAAKYRANIRNGVLKPLEAAGCVVEQVEDLAPVENEIHALYRAVQDNASFRPFLLPPAYFPALQRVMGTRFRCSVVRQSGKILGFLISVADGDTAIAYHIGFDRSAARELPIYLRLLHAGIADAIALGCTRVSFGRTALEPKAALGAKPENFAVLVRHSQPVLNKLLKRLLLGIDHAEAPTRNPFKNPAA